MLVSLANLLVTSHSAHGQTVNGHRVTTAEAAVLATYGITQGNWKMDGWGIVAVNQSADKPQAARCHFVLDVPLDCNLVVASK